MLMIRKLNSSFLGWANYDSRKQELEIEFLNGTQITYIEVPEWRFEDFIKAPSQGVYYNKFIKGNYQVKQPEEVI